MLGQPAVNALILTAALGTLTLSACTSSSGPDTASDQTVAPAVGLCRLLSVEDLAAASNDTPAVDCSQPHTAQTFLVGQLPQSTGESYQDRGHGRYVYDTCQSAFADFLGADESTVLRSRLSWAWFRATKKGWGRGARWFRCDVVGGPAEATTLRDLPRDARGLFATDFPDAWLTCARGETAEQGTKVSCDEDHDWRAVTTVILGEPTTPYPGDRIVEVLTLDYCRTSVRGWLGYPPDFDFGYTWFRQDRWDGGNRRSICWARTTK